MKSRFPGKCVTCKKPYAKDADIDYEKDLGAKHPACEWPPGPDASRIADDCGFLPTAEAMAANWVLRCMRSSNGSTPAGRPESAPLPRQVADLFGKEEE